MKKNAALIILIFACLACQRPESEMASVSIQIPTAQQFAAAAAKESAMGATVDYNRLCFAVVVKGPGVGTLLPATTCMVERMQMSSAVTTGQTLELDVVGGADRIFEVYGFLRNSAADACPATSTDSGWGSFPASKVYFLGSKAGVNVVPPTVSVPISITLPPDTMNIAAARSWPATCGGVAAGRTASFGHALLGAGSLASTSYKMRVHVSNRNHDAQLDANAVYKFKGGVR
jgi:hypothetical protein